MTNDEAPAAEIASSKQMERLPDIEDFWTTRSLEELAEAQRVEVVKSIQTIQDGTISDEEAEVFIAALEL